MSNEKKNNLTVEELQAKVNELSSKNSDLTAKVEELETSKGVAKEEYSFKADGEEYVFVSPTVKVLDKDGSYKIYTAQDLVATEGTGRSKKPVNKELLAKLVASGSGVIKKKGGK